MIHFDQKDRYGYEDLLEIIRILRSDQGCPWDRVQTHQSIRRGLLEEAYEAAEAIDLDDPALLQEELGDVLMQVVFHADIEKDAGRFTMEDVCDGVVRKLLYRHPHVFGDDQADTPEGVLLRWDQLKRAEKGQSTTADAMDSVARSLPGLWRAEKLQNKAAKAGWDRADIAGAMDKLSGEVASLQKAAASSDVSAALGNVLFCAVQVGRIAGIDPEDALGNACEDYIRRFRAVEHEAQQRGLSPDKLSSEEIDLLWGETRSS